MTEEDKNVQNETDKTVKQVSVTQTPVEPSAEQTNEQGPPLPAAQSPGEQQPDEKEAASDTPPQNTPPPNRPAVAGSNTGMTIDNVKPASQSSVPTTPKRPPQTVSDNDSEQSVELPSEKAQTVPEQQEEPNQKTDGSQPANNAKSTSLKLSLAIIVAVMVAIILVALGYVAYRANLNESQGSGNNSQQQQTEDSSQQIPPADTEAVDELEGQLEDLDQELQDIQQQLEAGDLSDESLGI